MHPSINQQVFNTVLDLKNAFEKPDLIFKNRFLWYTRFSVQNTVYVSFHGENNLKVDRKRQVFFFSLIRLHLIGVNLFMRLSDNSVFTRKIEAFVDFDWISD